MKIKKSPKTGKYSVEYLVAPGKSVTQKLNTTSKKEAEKIIRDSKIAELEHMAKVGTLQRDAISNLIAGKNAKVSHIINEWKQYKENLAHSVNTIYLQECMVNSFISYANIKGGISSITPKKVSEWLNSDDGVSLAQREQRLSAVRSLMEFAVAAGYTNQDPSKLVAIDKGKLSHEQKEERPKIAFKKAEYDKLVKHAPYFFRQAVQLCWWTGLRIVDVCGLEWSCFDSANETLTIHTQKRDKRICLPINDPLIGGGVLLNVFQQIEFNDPQYCFPEQREWMSSPKSRSKLSLYFSRLLQRLDMYEEGKGWHSLRRSFVSRCKREGKELEDIAIWVGHSNTKTTEKYAVDA